jgi:hypothetical protein
MNDHSLEQMVTKPTRGDRTLDLIFTNSPSSVNKVETMPPIGNADHDIVYAECSLTLKRKKRPRRKVYKYNKANWTNMKNDINKITENITSQYKTATSDNLWKIFKEQLLNSMETNIPHKLTTGKKKLPWVDDQLRLKLNKAKRLHRKRNNSEAQMKKYKHIKKTIQQDMRKAYWEFIEQMIFNILDQEPDECRKKQPKNLYSYIKSMKNDNTGIAALRKEGMLTDNTKDKADILNEQFKNIFSIETSSEQIPDKGKSSHPLMNNISISESGVTKLLQNINPHKATGPDEIGGRVLTELSTTMSRPLTLIFKKNTRNRKNTIRMETRKRLSSI